MSSNLHEVVQLLLARMKSHPEEFTSGLNRWGWMINDVMGHGTDEECAALKAGLRPIRLQAVHEFVLDELCNGEERRRKEQEEHEYEQRMMMQQAKTAKAVLLSQQQAMQSGSYGKSLVSARHPTSSDMEKNGIFNAIRNLVK